MMRNDLRAALRPWSKSNIHSRKNLLSLAMGIVCGAIVFLYLYGELSPARFFGFDQPLVQYHSQRFIEPPSYYANVNGRQAKQVKRSSASLCLSLHEVF